jgi:hypothetical protein
MGGTRERKRTTKIEKRIERERKERGRERGRETKENNSFLFLFSLVALFISQSNMHDTF